MLYLIEKLATAVRGGTREVLETAVDANALRILGQEIYEYLSGESTEPGSHRKAEDILVRLRSQQASRQTTIDNVNS